MKKMLTLYRCACLTDFILITSKNDTTSCDVDSLLSDGTLLCWLPVIPVYVHINIGTKGDCKFENVPNNV